MNRELLIQAVKKVKTIIKLNLPAGAATAAPPVGPALGQHGLPIMEFVKAYNERTAKLKGDEKSEAQTFLFHLLEAFSHDPNTLPENSRFEYRVSFAGDRLTYETVLENLNVLDYEYFFRITDQILQVSFIARDAQVMSKLVPSA